MEELKNIYKEEINLLQLFQDSVFWGLNFDDELYELKSSQKFMQKKLYKKVNDQIEIICKEKIYKKWIEKYLEIKISNKENIKNYQIFKIIVDNERISLICEKKQDKKISKLSKQYGLNGYIVYKFNDSRYNYILHQNVNNSLQYLEDFKENLESSVFKLEKDGIVYVSNFPYNLIYDAIVNCNVLSDRELFNIFEMENMKRKSIDSNTIQLKKITEYEKHHCESNINLVYEKTKDLYNYMINTILKNPEIDVIVQKGANVINQLNNSDEQKSANVTSSLNNIIDEVTELRMLKNQKLELIEIKKSTKDMINRLKEILIS